MIIIPSYDDNGVLNYFSGRLFYDSNEYMKHRNPSWNKNIVGNELFINWNEPLIIVEGPLDAITVKRNAIPLYGKNISKRLRLKIIENEVKKIYFALDPDAIKETIPIVEEFFNLGIFTYIVDLGDKDPNELGYEKFMDAVYKSVPLTTTSLMKMKISMK